MPCVLSIFLPSIVRPSASTGCSRCSDGFEAAPGYPPYNIERTGENDYRITVAVAGFGENELSIEAKENTLTIKGEKQAKRRARTARCSTRASRRARSSASSSSPTTSRSRAPTLENGLLHVDLVREIPEAKKPRQIPIGNGNAKPQVIDTKAAA